MKQLVFSLLCFLSISADAANRYVNSAASGMKHGNVFSVDGVNAPFAGRNAADWSQFRFGHDLGQESTGSTEANCFSFAGSHASFHGSL